MTQIGGFTKVFDTTIIKTFLFTPVLNKWAAILKDKTHFVDAVEHYAVPQGNALDPLVICFFYIKISDNLFAYSNDFIKLKGLKLTCW